MSLRILGLDISKMSTGVAMIDYDMEGITIEEAELLLCPKDFVKVTTKDLEFTDFLYWYFQKIHNIIKYYMIDVIAIEDLNIEYNRMAKVVLQLHAAVKIASRQYNIDTIPIHNMTVKSILKIGGKASRDPNIVKIAKKHKVKPIKVLTTDAVNMLLGQEFKYEENDIADAVSMAVAYLVKHKGVNIETISHLRVK